MGRTEDCYVVSLVPFVPDVPVELEVLARLHCLMHCSNQDVLIGTTGTSLHHIAELASATLLANIALTFRNYSEGCTSVRLEEAKH